MITIATSTPVCQVVPQRKTKKAQQIRNNQRIISACKTALGRMRRNSQQAANFIIKISQQHEGHKWSRETIAKMFGISVTSVKRIIKTLTDLGLAISINLYKRPNSYHIGPLCFNSYVRQSLVHLLPALRQMLNLVFLLSMPPNDPHVYKNIPKNESPHLASIKRSLRGEYNKFTRSYLEFIEAQPDDVSDNKRETSRHTPKKGCSMPEPLNLFRPAVESLSSFVLTPIGKAKASAFSNQVIVDSDKRCAAGLRKKAPDNPWGYFMAILNAISKERGERPDHNYSNELVRRMGLSENDSKIESIKIEIEATPQASNAKARASAIAWKAKLEADAKPYHDEQAELPNLTREMKLARIRPGIDNFKKCDPAMQKLLIKLHPFPDAAELIDELINGPKVPVVRSWTQEEISTWTPIAQRMGAYSTDKRAQTLQSYGMEEYIPLVEQLISQCQLVTPTIEEESVWEEIYT